MRDYLLSFMKDCGYADADITALIAAYDQIAENEAGNRLLTDAVAAYERDCALDYEAEILNRAKEISKVTLVHPYTADLIVFLCLTKHLKTLYVEKGLDLQIYRDSVLDLKWKLEECKLVKGIFGSFVASWFPGFFKLKRFALGRLQFEIIKSRVDYEKNGVRLVKGETNVINVHIPRTGTPMDRESCDRAYAMARDFFKGEAGENAAFVCHSWLLYPENKTLLAPHTNTYRFMSEYDIVKSDFNKGEDLWRLFDTDEKHPSRLPTNGSFRRAYVDHLKKGGRVGWGLGIKI